MDAFTERLFHALVSGSRPDARIVVEQALSEGCTAEQIVADMFWPAYQTIDRLHRADKLTTLSHHMATRLLRTLTDQAAGRFTRSAPRGRSVFAVCGPTDADELAAQMAVDLLEADGYDVVFAGGGIANDEILARVQAEHPDVLLLFASAPSDLPNIRSLIDTIQEIGACRSTQVAVGGGVFNRADGLAEEIGADIWASSPFELLAVFAEQADRRAEATQRTVGRKRRKAA